jgi:hypothetical protein
MILTSRRALLAALAGTLVGGCGRQPATKPPSVAANTTATFWVKDMGKELNLL